MARVLVLGAGFGGIATAVALRGQLAESDEVVLLDQYDDFAMGLRKTWAILGISPIAYGTRSLASLARRGIAFRQGRIDGVDPGSRTATVDGETIEADALVLALGAIHDLEAVPGLAEHGLNAWDRFHLDHVHGVVDAFRGGRVLIGIFGTPYSCPPAPFELAMLLSDRSDARGIEAQLTLFGPAPIPLPILGQAGGAPIVARLVERGIAYLGGRLATEVSRGTVHLQGNEELPFDVLLAVPPHRVPSVLVEAGLADGGGWVSVDRATLETGHPGVYAIGDCVGITLANGLPLPKAGLFAERQGEAVATRIAATLRGEAPTTTFDGNASCFVEMGNGEASTVQGGFYADPLDVSLTMPSVEQRAAKERFEMERLARWFGA
ncbi:MAG: NAD(P)/FAD-dependent oxidoreductase [Chloroflexi bacterium]|nr:MAG: NAD(P)/FAD-dependent oxidoreductase [Chloroflexota bacterium]